MENVKKVTKKENFEMVREILVNENREDLVAFVDHELELLAKKSGVRKTNAIAEERAEKVFEVLAEAEAPMTIAEVITAGENVLVDEEGKVFTNQRVSALMKKLVDAGRVTKAYDKKKAYFSIAD